MNNNAVIYTRFSSASQDPQTCEVQEKKGREFAGANNISVIKVYKDEAKTGRNGDRQGLQDVLKDFDRGLEFQYFIVYNTDRYFREAAEGMQFRKELTKRGIQYLSTTEHFEDNAAGKLNFNMQLVIAQYYSDLYSEKITNGLANNASKFLSTGGQISFGYKTVDKIIYIDEEKAPYVKAIYEMYLKGSTVLEIADYLNNLGITTNKKNGKFNKNSLRTILTSKKYIGYYTFKGQEIPNAHPRIIDDELFYKVQEKITKVRKSPASNKAKDPYLLTGKAFCGYCEDMLYADGGYNRSQVHYKYYVCKTKKTKKTCNKATISKEKLEDKIINEARNLLNNKVIENIIRDTVLTLLNP